MHRAISYLLILLLMHAGVMAQQKPIGESSLRQKKIPANTTSWVLDTLPIVPGTFQIDAFSFANTYHVNCIESRLIWDSMPMPIPDSLMVRYRVYPFKLNQFVSRRNYEDYRFNFLASSPIVVGNEKSYNPFSDLQTLQTDGSIGRTLIISNNQDVVLNANMNLQMKGFIGDSIELQALISDNNLPIQPEGNTRDLRDMDKIFIQAKKNNWQVQMGDLDLKSDQFNYMKFYKRIQGVGYSINTKLSRHAKQSTSVHAAVAKGKFNRNNIITIEGNQGPYRLKGANNELYFIVLAGTEKVFADGQLLQRGSDQDYIINYNTAEIIFTPRFQVTKDSRIQVEFEYADRNYLNSQIYLTESLKFKDKLDVKFGFFSNQDAKNTGIDQVMNIEQKRFLQTVGDSVQQAFYQDAYRDTLGEGKILYKKVDTLYQNNLHDSVYVYSMNPADELYALSFTYVGQGKGNYRQLANAGNGKIYQWVAPNASLIKQGDYEPVVLLITPKLLQLYSMAVTYKAGKRTVINTDVSMSRNDVNLFAVKDKSNDLGIAGNVKIKTGTDSFGLFGKTHTMQFDGGYEKITETYRTVERYRQVEFYRDWSLGIIPTPTKEMLADAHFSLRGKEKNALQYGVSNYTRGDGYKGYMHRFSEYYSNSFWTIDAKVSALQFRNNATRGSFYRPLIDLDFKISKSKNINLHLQGLAEVNTLNIHPDTLSLASFAFSRYEAGLRSGPDNIWKWGVKYFTRKDWKPQLNSMIAADQSHNISANIAYTENPNHQIAISAGYRKLDVFNTQLSGQKNEQTVVGQIDYGFHWFKDFMNGIFYYELGGGQEPKRDYAFVPVPVGQGNYTWIDYNGNGIEELNEFELALYPDQKKYIRIQVPGTQFTRVNAMQLNYNLEINPAVLCVAEGKQRSWLKRVSASTSMQINRKQLATAGILYDPGFKSIADSNLVSLSTILNHIVYINRLSSKWGIDLISNSSRNRSLYIYGFEDRNIKNIQSKGRWNLKKSWVWTVSANWGDNQLTTTGAKFENRNYSINKKMTESGLTYLYKNSFRATLGMEWSDAKNNIDSMEHVLASGLNIEVKYNLASNTSVSLRGSFRRLKFDAYAGAAQTPVGFVMLDGLQPGGNQLWGIDIMKRLAKNMELNFQYEGRRLSGGKMIHSGRASVRAVF